MTPRERIFEALNRRPTDIPAVGNATSIATVELMEATGSFFPEAHLDAEAMTTLAAAGHEILHYDTIAPVFSVQHEADALGCEVDWGRVDMMPDATVHPCESAADIRLPADLLRHPALVVVLDSLRLLRERYPDVCLVGKVFGPWTLAYHLFGVEKFLMMTLDDPDEVHAILRALMPLPELFAHGSSCKSIQEYPAALLPGGALAHGGIHIGAEACRRGGSQVAAAHSGTVWSSVGLDYALVRDHLIERLLANGPAQVTQPMVLIGLRCRVHHIGVQHLVQSAVKSGELLMRFGVRGEVIHLVRVGDHVVHLVTVAVVVDQLMIAFAHHEPAITHAMAVVLREDHPGQIALVATGSGKQTRARQIRVNFLKFATGGVDDGREEAHLPDRLLDAQAAWDVRSGDDQRHAH